MRFSTIPLEKASKKAPMGCLKAFGRPSKGPHGLFIQKPKPVKVQGKVPDSRIHGERSMDHSLDRALTGP